MIAPEILASDTTEHASALWDVLVRPALEFDWRFWRPSTLRTTWLASVFDDRLRVLYFLPLLGVLLWLRGRALKTGIVVTCCIFLAYNFGLCYPLFWLLLCAAFYRLTEQWAFEIKRTDVLKIGPPLAAVGCVLAVPVLTSILKVLPWPSPDWNNWINQNLPLIFPLGTRPLDWEPHWVPLANGAPPLFAATFFDLHYVGVAYFMARMLHYFSELKRDGIPAAQRSFLNFLAYLCYAPTLMQGPIERYPRFFEEIDTCHQRRSWSNLPAALTRAGLGLAKVLFSTIYLHPFLWRYGFAAAHPAEGYYGAPEEIGSYAVIYFGVFIEIFALYLEFSAYCDFASAMSRVLGYRLAENFCMPWIATSMRDFWRRWHLTLSFILRDYVYIALGGNRKHVWFNLCFTFFLCGIWHRTVPKVAIWGIVMGLMVYANQRWVDWVKQLDAHAQGPWAAARRRWLTLRPLPQITAWLITQHAFVFSLLIFFGGEGAIRVGWELIRRPLNAWFAYAGYALELPPVNAWFASP